MKWYEQIGTLLKNNATAAAWVAVVGVLGSTFIEIKQDRRAGFADIAESYREDVIRLREVEARCLQFELEMGRKLSALQSKIVLLESASQDLPFPHWLKSSGTAINPGVMLSLNKAYELEFLAPRGKTAADYIGKTDVEFWGEELGERYWRLDLDVIRRKTPIETNGRHPLDGSPVRVMKYPRMLGNRVIGIGGIVIPEKPLRVTAPDG